jgi:TolB-like protein
VSWCLWKERNARVFDNNLSSIQAVVDEILQEVAASIARSCKCIFHSF